MGSCSIYQGKAEHSPRTHRCKCKRKRIRILRSIHTHTNVVVRKYEHERHTHQIQYSVETTVHHYFKIRAHTRARTQTCIVTHLQSNAGLHINYSSYFSNHSIHLNSLQVLLLKLHLVKRIYDLFEKQEHHFLALIFCPQ